MGTVPATVTAGAVKAKEFPSLCFRIFQTQMRCAHMLFEGKLAPVPFSASAILRGPAF